MLQGELAMTLLRIPKVAAVGLLSAGVGLSFAVASIASAAPTPSIPLPRAASRLARMIRRDASTLRRSNPGLVTTSLRCCKVSRLEVHYPTPVSGLVLSSQVVLVLESSGGEIHALTITQTALTSVKSAYVEQLKETFQIALRRDPDLPHAPLTSYETYTAGLAEEAPNPPPGGFTIPAGEGCNLPRAIPRAAFERAVRLLDDTAYHSSPLSEVPLCQQRDPDDP